MIYPYDAASVDELIAAADSCLRGAKVSGKDRALSTLDWAPTDGGVETRAHERRAGRRRPNAA